MDKRLFFLSLSISLVNPVLRRGEGRDRKVFPEAVEQGDGRRVEGVVLGGVRDERRGFRAEHAELLSARPRLVRKAGRALCACLLALAGAHPDAARSPSLARHVPSAAREALKFLARLVRDVLKLFVPAHVHQNRRVPDVRHGAHLLEPPRYVRRVCAAEKTHRRRRRIERVRPKLNAEARRVLLALLLASFEARPRPEPRVQTLTAYEANLHRPPRPQPRLQAVKRPPPAL
mmetsp:Transcript_18038/g.58892  ORF Transcript_18038/g.58892 Transcript_18038/m.58892 type:complete len:232 (-) Transcript_18038:744-1439(-)